MTTARPLQPAADVRFPQLDGARGLAIALVVIWHDVYGLVQVQPGSMSAYAMRGLSLSWAGVDLFFVLSGFLIGGILLDNRNSDRYFRTFYIRRACRIFPLYYLVLGAFLLCAAFGPFPRSAWRDWLLGDAAPAWTYATYLQNFAMVQSGLGANWMGVTWSLAVEEQFYLLAPLLVRYVSPAVLPTLLVVLIAAAPLCRTALQWSVDPSGLASYILLPARWDALFMGVLAAWAFRQPHLVTAMPRARRAIRLALAAGCGGLVALIAASQNIGTWGMTSAGYTLIAGCALCLLTLAMTGDGAAERVLRWRPLAWLGTVSYGVYLFHRPVTGLMHGVLLNQPPRVATIPEAGVTVLGWLLTLSMAALSARFIERPIVAAGRRFARY